MDAGRIWLVSTIASVGFGLALAPQSSRAAGQSGWTGGASTTAPGYPSPGYPAPNYAAPSYDRYGNPTSAAQPNYGQPPANSQQTQYTASGTNSPGYNQQPSGWGGPAAPPSQPAGATIRSQQAPGTTGGQSRYSNPFATQAPAPTTTSGSRNSSGPPPWPGSSQTTPVAATPGWPDSTSTSTLATPTSTGNGWTSIGTSIAAPPMLVPQLSSTSFATSNSPASTVVAPSRSTSSFPTDFSAQQDSTHSVLAGPSQPAPAQPTTSRSAFDDWNISPDTTRASIGRSANNTSRTDNNRDFNVTPVGPVTVASQPQDVRKTTAAKSTDMWSDDPAGKAWPGGAAAPTITASGSKSPPTTTGNSAPFNNQSFGNSPALSPPIINSAPGNNNVAGPSLGSNPTMPAPSLPNHSPTAATATTPQQPWVPMIAAVLSLAGSLAANFFLGWSYIDARQKYQSLVRRTADSFRRTKPAAA